MKWHKFFRGRHVRQLDIPEDDSVHKRSKHLNGEERPFDHGEGHHGQQHADDRTEATLTSCGCIDPPKSPHSPIPQHIVQRHHDCSAIPEKTRSDPIVRFSTVEMRHYQRIVGDHPDVEIPLAIGWEYVQGSPVQVAEFEEEKEARAKDDEGCGKKELQLPFNTTHKINIMEPLEPSRLDSLPPASNGNENHRNKKAKALQRAAAFTENVRTGLLTHKSTQHKNPADLANNYLEPISMKERIFLLQKVGGFSLKQIHQAERRRRVQIVLEWAYRQDAQDQTDPCTVRNCTELFKRYIV